MSRNTIQSKIVENEKDPRCCKPRFQQEPFSLAFQLQQQRIDQPLLSASKKNNDQMSVVKLQHNDIPSQTIIYKKAKGTYDEDEEL